MLTPEKLASTIFSRWSASFGLFSTFSGLAVSSNVNSHLRSGLQVSAFQASSAF